MSLQVTGELLLKTTHADLSDERDYAKRYGSRERYDSNDDDREFEVKVSRLSDEAIVDLNKAATKIKDGKTARATDAILQARHGKFTKTVPSFKAFQGMLEAFLKRDLIDGWIYVEGKDGHHYPELVTQITFDSGANVRRGEKNPTVKIHTSYYGFDRGSDKSIAVARGCHTFQPGDVANRTVGDILAGSKIYKETTALKEAYQKSALRHEKRTMHAFAKQFRFTGDVFHYCDYQRGNDRMDAINRKVVHDLPVSELGPISTHVESDLFDEDKEREGLGVLPHHPLVRVFDLRTHEFYWVNTDLLTDYVYDKSLREKLVLPTTHHDLLDVLTSDTDVLTADIIEGKSAGNIVMGKGEPGVGKTLTAEVYAELIERPLYSVHSGTLGVTAEEIEKNLATVFRRAKRWNCVLLLDEADVFVMTRGDDIQLNAIVAEFLRTLEYFDGLMFMTTNRPDDIDEAIISRCAAIIEYVPPDRDDAAKVWKVMAEQFKTELPEELIVQLLDMFPGIAPRDIKMLFRLTLRVCARRKVPLTLDIFRQCAMFRAIKIVDPKKKK
jgi:hypothetical protein